MWYTYVLQSIRSLRLYTGLTSDLRRRVQEHNSRRGGEYTSKNGPFRLVFYEAFLAKEDASKAEKFFKTGNGREILKGKIKNSLEC